MATALDVITRAMRLIGALAEAENPSASQSDDALTALQAMLGEWETRGVKLGAVVDMTFAAATTIPVPVTHLNAMVYGLAMELAPEYGALSALPALQPKADRAFRMLQAQYKRAPVIGADPAVVYQRGIINHTGVLVNADGENDPLLSGFGPIYP